MSSRPQDGGDTADQGGDPAGSELLTGRRFGSAFRGYDRNEVHAFLSEVAEQQRRLEARASESEARLAELQSRLASVEGLLEAADEKYAAAQAHLAALEEERAAANAETRTPEDEVVKSFGEKVTEVLQIAVAAGNSIREEAETWASQRKRQADIDAANAIATARQEVADIVAREETTVEQLRTTEQALRNWLHAAHNAIGQVLQQPAVGPDDLAAVVGRIRELGPSRAESIVVDEAGAAEEAPDGADAGETDASSGDHDGQSWAAETPAVGLLIS